MRNVFIFLCCISIFSSIFSQSQPSPKARQQKVPMEPAYWEVDTDQVTFKDHLGTPSIEGSNGGSLMRAKDLVFTNGTIEFDVVLPEGGFVSIYFRRQSEDESELFYFRPYQVGNPMGGDVIQYAPVIQGINLWDMMHHYQGSANLIKDQWNHIKMVISENQMLVFINREESPTLTIPKLEGNTDSGEIALQGNAIFANLIIHHNDVMDLSHQAGADLTQHDPRYLRKWKISPPIAFPFGEDLKAETLPNDSTTWEEIVAEGQGLVNITRRYGGSKDRSTRRLVWLKKDIYSDRNQEIRLDLGFSDEVWLTLDNQLVYLDKNYYNSPIMKEPKGRISLENSTVTLRLKEGKNELMVGVGNFFFGWGIMARIHTVDGIQFEEPAPEQAQNNK